MSDEWEYDNDGTGSNVSQFYVANGGRFLGVALGVARTGATDSTGTGADGGILRSRLARSTAANPPGCSTPDNNATACNNNAWENNSGEPSSVDPHISNKEVDHANLYRIFSVDRARCS